MSWAPERIALAALLLAAPAFGADPAPEPRAGLAACKAVAGDTERLHCYDALAAQADGTAERDFGLARKPEAEAAAREPELIRARLNGRFASYERGTRFALDNGQVWKSSGTASGYYPGVPENPEVAIERSLFGSYWMNVLGGSQPVKLKVERVR